MTREEMIEIIKKIQSAYPNFKVEDKQALLDTWYECLGHVDFKAVALALKNYIMSDTTGFAPTIGHINNNLHDILEKIEGGAPTEMEAWNLVSNALRRSGWHAEEEFSKLPPPIQRAVGSAQMLHNWAVDENYNESVVMSNFQRSYRAVVEQGRQERRMPLDIQHMIQQKQQERLQIEDTKDE